MPHKGHKGDAGYKRDVANNVVIYARVSTKEQAKEGASLETQEEACRNECVRRGWNVIKVFVEAGESAKTTKRKKLQEMLAFCHEKRGMIRAVVVYAVSRFSRSSSDHHALRLILANLGVSVISVTEPFDDSSEGKLMEGIFAQFAQYDNDKRSDRTKAGMEFALRNGRWCFAAPVGYLQGGRPPNSSLIIDSEKAPLIKKAFELVASGECRAHEALRKVAALGLTSQFGNKLCPQVFIRLLRNPLYAGQIIVPKWPNVSPTQGDFEAIVDQGTFDRAQVMLSKHSCIATRHLRSNADFPLRRFVICGHCGNPLTGSWSKGRKTRYAYYRCHSCKLVNVPKGRLENEFSSYLEQIRPKAGLMKLFDAVVLDVWHRRREGALREIEVQNKQVAKLVAQRDELEKAHIFEKSISRETYNRHHARLSAEILVKEMVISESKLDELEVERVLAFARYMMENARNLWLRASHDQKETLQRVWFPNRLPYKNGEFGTAVSGSAFDLVCEISAPVHQRVTPTGFEPVLR